MQTVRCRRASSSSSIKQAGVGLWWLCIIDQASKMHSLQNQQRKAGRGGARQAGLRRRHTQETTHTTRCTTTQWHVCAHVLPRTRHARRLATGTRKRGGALNQRTHLAWQSWQAACTCSPDGNSNVKAKKQGRAHMLCMCRPAMPNTAVGVMLQCPSPSSSSSHTPRRHDARL